MARERLVMRTTMLIELTGLRDRRTGEYPIDATVEADLLTSAEVAVTGGDNLPIVYEDDTSGSRTVYYGRIPSTVTLTEDAEYIVRVAATWLDALANTIVRGFDIDCVAVRK